MNNYVSVTTVCCLTANAAIADLRLNIDRLTSSDFAFTVSGTFDSSVGGDQKNWLAVKPNWSTNYGVNVPWIDDSAGFGELGSSPFTIHTNSIRINGTAPNLINVAATDVEWGDSFYFRAPFDILAGMTVSGTLSVSLRGVFDDALSPSDFELLSGFDDVAGDWNRREAVAPAPAAGSVFAIAGLFAVRRRRR